MIRIPRQRVRPPAVLTVSDGPAERERKQAALHFQKLTQQGTSAEPENGKKHNSINRKTFEFKIYKNEAVKAKLEELFHGKCAYCESYYAAVHPVDVEHWRPKAEVAPETWESSDAQPGYWFLASDWENLLPSCIDCNRARKQNDLSDGKTRLAGKANRFPVERDSLRASSKDGLKNERPLLLHPCEDDPSNHLQCDPADPSILRPQNESAKGQYSIGVYGLNRASLVIARRERLAKIRLHLYQLKTVSELLQRPQSEAEQRILDDLREYELKAIESFRREDQPYTMMSRAIIDDFMNKLFNPAHLDDSIT